MVKEERRFPQVSVPQAVKFSANEPFPAQPSPTNAAAARPSQLPAQDLPADRESPHVSDAVDPPLLSMEEDISEDSNEGSGERSTEDIQEDIPVPERMPSEEDIGLGGPVETPSNLATMSPHATDAPVTVTDSGDREGLYSVSPAQFVRHSSRQRQLPQRLQYSGLGKPLISAVQALLHSLADAYSEVFTISDTSVYPHVLVV